MERGLRGRRIDTEVTWNNKIAIAKRWGAIRAANSHLVSAKFPVDPERSRVVGGDGDLFLRQRDWDRNKKRDNEEYEANIDIFISHR